MIHIPQGQDTGAIIGFGSSFDPIPILPAPSINLMGGPGLDLGMAYSMPFAAGNVLRLTVHFQPTVNFTIPAGSTLNINTEVYFAAGPNPGNLFVGGTGGVTFSIAGPATIFANGPGFDGTAIFPTLVTTQARMAIASRVFITGTPISATVQGYISGGVGMRINSL